MAHLFSFERVLGAGQCRSRCVWLGTHPSGPGSALSVDTSGTSAHVTSSRSQIRDEDGGLEHLLTFCSVVSWTFISRSISGPKCHGSAMVGLQPVVFTVDGTDPVRGETRAVINPKRRSGDKLGSAAPSFNATPGRPLIREGDGTRVLRWLQLRGVED